MNRTKARRDEDCEYCGYPFDEGDSVVVPYVDDYPVYCSRGCLLKHEGIEPTGEVMTPQVQRHRYSIGNMFFAGLTTDERSSWGNRGIIAIGGENGNVTATCATNSEHEREIGVMLQGATFLTILNLTREQAADEACKAVYACYKSIQEDTFRQSTRAVCAGEAPP